MAVCLWLNKCTWCLKQIVFYLEAEEKNKHWFDRWLTPCSWRHVITTHIFSPLSFFVQARIAKRDRKLVDYDSARHNYATTHKTKKKDGGIKITKVKQMHNMCCINMHQIWQHLTCVFSPFLPPSLFQPSSLLERATPGWAQGILSAHNVAQSSLSRSQVHDNLTDLPARSVDCETMIRLSW